MTPESPDNQRPFMFPLTFDPLRILHGIRSQWLWFVLLPIGLATAGVYFGLKTTQDRFSVSLQLIHARRCLTYLRSIRWETLLNHEP